ncbi:hypothetical protein K488DRAFT_91248 [Vararia minispora EC-137]|uniref:Uncharacterized protein n=1 Tax=Vararia minispora EC-137 TaxID=1314806 RepID=A0ACB8Q687_9AGAM|nr:hypothetical protein K488DRAFT_91248 [Vararia minispora EC-137]
MSGYSSVFSLGLLATPRPLRVAAPGAGLPIDIDVDIDDPETTPTRTRSPPDDLASLAPRSRTSSTTSADSAAPPRLRRRRSSLTVAAAPLAAIKSPLRSAGTALQRTLIRARSGSVSTAPAPADDVLGAGSPLPSTSTPIGAIKGRLRSGSVGAVLRPRQRAAARKPPPTAPLPALPPAFTARRPLLHRAVNSDGGAEWSAAAAAPVKVEY